MPSATKVLKSFFNQQACKSSLALKLGLATAQKVNQPDPYCFWDIARTLN